MDQGEGSVSKPYKVYILYVISYIITAYYWNYSLKVFFYHLKFLKIKKWITDIIINDPATCGSYLHL